MTDKQKIKKLEKLIADYSFPNNTECIYCKYPFGHSGCRYDLLGNKGCNFKLKD